MLLDDAGQGFVWCLSCRSNPSFQEGHECLASLCDYLSSLLCRQMYEPSSY
ncbi:unnamed protein product [Periconia digitata]|uniref:Uncharacterized protein n=1 Tax=Periconia digitata TaxID=1303443 RepID=A0A9W4U0Y2_9PLEO|nr:unnamed protein product [Periconia digitata]